MSTQPLSTDPYKGVRDFYPEEMAIQQYIFDSWARTARSFGFQQYDASILEPAELYKSKGAENEEMVNEQTYTFTDRGGREVTLRPEMTPTVARLVAARRRTAAFPLRWFSIPNLFRYERPQRGRLREHWQLNCDIFGTHDSSTDIEIILLAAQLLTDFGATTDMFEIRVNNRKTMQSAYQLLGITDPDQITAITRITDRKQKLSPADYRDQLTAVVNDDEQVAAIIRMIEDPDGGDNAVVATLREHGFTNVRIDRSLARGFDYYTGTIFEIFDTHESNNRAMLGGGRYDNLTGLFGGDPVSGIGFGMGDVTMRDFLTTHHLLPDHLTQLSPQIIVVPTDAEKHIAGQMLAHTIRQHGFSIAVDTSGKRFTKKISDAAERGAQYLIVVGDDEIATKTYQVKHLTDGSTTSGTLPELLSTLSTQPSTSE